MVKYEDLNIYKEGHAFVLEAYNITFKFPEHETNNLTSQIRRASVSIPLNIAEGSTRASKKAFLQFLNYAYGSCKELEVLFSLSKDLKYIPNDEYLFFYDRINKLSRMIFKFVGILRKDINKKMYFKNVDFS